MTPPTPCREFIEAFRRRLGVDARASILIELGLRGSGLRGEALPLGDEAARCPNGFGEDECGEAGGAVAEAPPICEFGRGG